MEYLLRLFKVLLDASSELGLFLKEGVLGCDDLGISRGEASNEVVFGCDDLVFCALSF